MRRVKCQDTGEYSTNDIAYKAANGKYYSSEAAYIQLVEQQQQRQKCIDLLYDILDFDRDIIVPSILFKNLKNYEKVGYDVVYETILEERNDINWALNNIDFKNITGMIIYVCKILENHMLDVYKRKQHDKRVAEKQNDVVIPSSTEVRNKKQKTKDISRFLEE